MITGMHGMYFSEHADELRAFFRDVLALPTRDVGDGWLIFDLPHADLGVHPTDHPGSPPPGTHAVSFQCDDIEGTVATLRARGVTFTDEITDQGWGLVVHLMAPGGLRLELYQPRY